MIKPFKHHQPQLGQRVFVDDTAVVIGKVTLGDDVSVWPLTVIRGDVHTITIGRQSNVQDGSVLHVTSPKPHVPEGFPLVIGEQVTIGHKVMLHGCTIGDRCLIGMGAIVLDGAVIENDVLLGAGSLVAPGKRLTRGGLYQGIPARRVRDLSEQEIARFVDGAEHYVDLKNQY